MWKSLWVDFQYRQPLEISIQALTHKVLNVNYPLKLSKTVEDGDRAQIVFVPYEQVSEEGFDGILRSILDFSRIQSLLGLKPQQSLNESLFEILQ